MESNVCCWILGAITLATIVTNGESKMVDMTHYLNKDAKHYQLFRDFELKAALNHTFSDKLWVLANEFYMNEHTGTHIDAPAHTHLGGKFMHQVPITDLVGPAVVFDLREKAKSDKDYGLTVEDIRDHEAKYGRIQEGSIIFINTGGSKLYWDIEEYYGTKTPSDSKSMHYPGFSGPATDHLIQQRKIKGIGTDRMSFDVGSALDFPVHYSVSSQGIWGLENLNRVEELPERGATVFVMPILIENGSGAPSRIVAFWDVPDLTFGSGSYIPRGGTLAVFAALVFTYLMM